MLDFCVHGHLWYFTVLYGSPEGPSIAVYHFDHFHSIFNFVDFHSIFPFFSRILGLPTPHNYAHLLYEHNARGIMNTYLSTTNAMCDVYNVRTYMSGRSTNKLSRYHVVVSRE